MGDNAGNFNERCFIKSLIWVQSSQKRKPIRPTLTPIEIANNLYSLTQEPNPQICQLSESTGFSVASLRGATFYGKLEFLRFGLKVTRLEN